MPRALLLSLLFAVPASAAEVTVSPAAIEIHHHRHPHSISVVGITPEGFNVDLRAIAKFSIADKNVATVDASGWVHPVTSGETTLTVTADGQTKTIPVKVKLPQVETPASFRHEVMPILTRAGCNAGACHGYSLGKNGFKLSLRGQDPDADYPSIVREFAARRVNFQFPESSLLIAKGRGDTAHEGGVRFAKGSPSDLILTQWVRAGAPSDLADKAEVTGVKLIPERLALKPGDQAQLQLLATYTDGTVRDVTHFGVFSVNNAQFATVTDDGLLTAVTAGETAIVGRFERSFASTGATVLKLDPTFKPTPVPNDNLIDRAVIEKLNRLKIKPSELASDEVYLRRVSLDLIGVQPKPDEVLAFTKDADPKKREKIVDTLFERPEFVDWWSLKWGDLLQNSRNSVSSPSMYLFREFIRSAVAANTPLDEFARTILTARGAATDQPASVYFTISKDTNDTVERATQVFSGVRMLCARCHTHPLENWTQADYFGIASFFSQVSVKADPHVPIVPGSKMVMVNSKAGDATHPRTGKSQPPKFLGGPESNIPAGADRRAVYAEWLTSPKNPFFARSLTNRIWSYFFHRGVIDPVDDIRSTNPPINPQLLDALTADFTTNKFDARHLMKRIVTSATYQRSSVANESNKHDEQNFARSVPRRIPAEALFDSLVQSTGVPESINGAPGGFRAAQHPDGTTDNDFLKLFGKPQRIDACECERDNGSNMMQALNMINGKTFLNRVKNPASRTSLLAKSKKTDAEIVIELYLWCIARTPTEKELKLGSEFLGEAGADRTTALQDLMWALLNSRDFLLAH